MKRVLCIGLLWILLGAAACGPAAQPTPSSDLATMLTDAKAALDARNPDLAIAILQQALRANANSPEAHFLLGNAYAQKGMFSQAESEYLAVLRLNERDVDARSNLGVVYYQQQKFTDAEKAFRTALTYKPDDAEIHYNLGGVLAALNRLNEAEVEFLKAKELNPDLAELYLGLGSVYKLQGRKEEAIAALREFLRRAQDPTWVGQAEQWLKELGSTP